MYESKKRYDLKYQRERLVQISLKIKPEEKAAIDAAAAAAGKSTRAFILEAVHKQMG